MRLLNKVVLITGSASGIGRASAILFSQEGAKISVVDIDRKGGEQTVDLIKQKDGSAIFIQTDVSKANDIERMIRNRVNQRMLPMRHYTWLRMNPPWLPV